MNAKKPLESVHFSNQAAIKIRGARTHNLKNIDLDIPKNTLTVITGLSGSGKSSLAFDTLYAEGQGRYIESLSTYARQFLQRMDRPDVDFIEGLSPAIAIEQKTGNHNPRSTVGTITEIHDYLRLLFARIGSPFCPTHQLPLQIHSVAEIVDSVLALPPDSRIMILAPISIAADDSCNDQINQLKAQGFVRFRLNRQLVDTSTDFDYDRTEPPQLEVVIDRLKIRPENQQRLADSIETALHLANNRVVIFDMQQQQELRFNTVFACQYCDYSIPILEPKQFSFNSPAGACPECNGLGKSDFFDIKKIISFPSLSLPSGAVHGWDSRNSFYHSMLQQLAQQYGFDLSLPYEELPAEIQQIILYGDQENEPGGFEGIIPNFERRYRESDSHFVREKLAGYLTTRCCPSCHGSRLNQVARNTKLIDAADAGININDLGNMSLHNIHQFFEQLVLPKYKAQIAQRILQGIQQRLQFLNNVGLGYLNLNRAAATLSGGETQRIRLAAQIGAGLSGILYVLDEPSIGLHQRDNDQLIETLKKLRDLGNTVIVIEHDEDTINAADYIVDMGPGAGADGGAVIACGSLAEITSSASNSITAAFLSGERKITVNSPRLSVNNQLQQWLELKNASGNNLQNVDLSIPVGLFTCITGVSGSGKSTLINRTLFPIASNSLNRSKLSIAPYGSIDGLDNFDKVINIDQTAIGRTPRSNPATYTGTLTIIRELFASTTTAQERGYSAGRFSFNVSGGRCEICHGDGLIKIEMHFLSDVYVPCDSCKGQRFNRETLEVLYKQKNIAQVLDMTVSAAYSFFQNIPALEKKLSTMLDVGLGYVRLGQSATTLSGGEAQRIKLALELARKDTGRTLYILDEPTTGLHFADIEMLLKILFNLRDAGNSIVIIEHNLDVIKCADWIVDLGPEGGDGGGKIIAAGTPEHLIKQRSSHTGKYLKQYLSSHAKRRNLSSK